MEILTKDGFFEKIDFYFAKINNGGIFVYPTDTIYGIGCDATNADAVKKLREIKKCRHFLSVIVPGREWIKENCVVTKEAEKWLEKLPGAYTIVMKLKNKNAVAAEVNNNADTLGIRIPDHWFIEIVNELGIPIVTTSANISGEPYMVSIDGLSPEIKAKIDFIVYEGKKPGKPSAIVKLNGTVSDR